MYIRILSVIIIGFGFVASLYATRNLQDSAESLGRVLELDLVARTDTGSFRNALDLRSRILIEESQSLKNIFDTWNLVPTTDRTLDYHLALQQYRLSCEISAMRTVFYALGYPRTEVEIIMTLPHAREPYDKKSNTWGDPDRAFVGRYDGSQNDKTGYGIYEGAIASYFHQVLSADNIETEAYNIATRPESLDARTHLTHLLDALDKGKHIILWGDWCTDPLYEDGIIKKDHTFIQRMFPIPAKNICKNYLANRRFTWKTTDGKTVPALYGDHVFVLLGYIGKKESPSHIIVWDTDTGRHIYPTVEWLRKWSLMDDRSLIISR